MNKFVTLAVGVIAVVALVMSFSSGKQEAAPSLADQVIDRGEIRIGYIVYPPLLMKDETTGQLSGVSYDLVEAAATKLGLKTNWVEEVGWGSAIEGLKTDRYDMVGTQMWKNSGRAREAVFSVAPMNSVVFPYVRTGDDRFADDLGKLNASTFTISTLDGEMSSFIAKDDYPNAKTNTLPQLSSFAEVLLNVANGKADVTFAEPSVANDFLKSNPGTLERVGDTPIRTFGNCFLFVRGEDEMASMWSTAMEELVNNGTVERTLAKYGVDSDYVLNK